VTRRGRLERGRSGAKVVRLLGFVVVFVESEKVVVGCGGREEIVLFGIFLVL